MKMKFQALILTATLLGILSGCNNNKGAIKIALDIEDEGRYEELFTYFFEQTGIEVAATYGEDISKLIGTANEPDIIKTSTVVVTSMKDSLLDLTTLINADSEIQTSNYIDVLMDALTIDGKIYALPTSINTSLLYYNKDLFDASETELRIALDLGPTESVYPQATWDYSDYQTAGITLSKYTVGDEGNIYSQFGAEVQLTWWGEWLVYLNQMGGSFYQEGSNERVCALDSSQALEATEFYVEKSMGDATKKFAPNAVEAVSSFSFLSGNVAMIFGGHMGDWHSYDTLGLNWGIQMLPTPVGHPDARGGEISADAFGISLRSQKQDQAFSFLKMWSGNEGALQMYKYGKVGALKSMHTLIETLPLQDQGSVDLDALFNAIDIAITLPKEKDFSNIMRSTVMSELYRLMITGRGSETDVQAVLLRIKGLVDQYYLDLYGA